MIVAGFDIATTTGAAILDGIRVLHAEAFRAPGKTDPEIFSHWRTWFSNMLITHGVREVAIEQPLVTDIKAPNRSANAKPGETHNPITMKTYLRLYGLRAHAVEICQTLRIPCLEVHQGTWRKSFTGNGKASKEQSLLVARQLYPGLKSKDAAEAIGIAWHLNGELNHRDSDMFARGAAA